MVDKGARVKLEQPQAYVDEVNQDHISGWALSIDGIDRVDVLVDGRCVGQAQTGLLRTDVGDAFPGPEPVG